MRSSSWGQGSRRAGHVPTSIAPPSPTRSARPRVRRREQPMPPGRKIREPSMPPSMQRVKGERLRTGWTTGTCAAAAAKAAAKALIGGVAQEEVGLVTKPGLGLTVGGPAINEVPRRMISYSVEEVLNPAERGVRVVISVPGGEKMAEKTTNPRLGIVGGISILGTTGIVRPFSTASWRASVGQAISVMGAQGHDTLVLSTGGLTEKAAMRLLPDLEEVCFVEVGDFTGYALKGAAKNRLERVFFVGMVGKLTKLAAGVMMTHWTRSKVDNELLAEVTEKTGGDAGLVEEVQNANTARHAYELWREAGLKEAPHLLCALAAENLKEYAEGKLEAHVLMVDFDTLDPVGASPGALALTTWAAS